MKFDKKNASYTYNRNKSSLNIKLLLDYSKYGSVVCHFYVKVKKEINVELVRANVENTVIPYEEHQELLQEIKNDEELIAAVKDFSVHTIAFEEIEIIGITDEPREAKTEQKLTLEYVSVLEAKSYSVEETKRTGPKLSNVEVENVIKHYFLTSVKFNEIKYEYKITVRYSSSKGYTFQVYRKQNRNKPYMELDDDLKMFIVRRIQRKIKYSHTSLDHVI
ncbi:hypothetical protein [Bacillus toyonensis]|uniref:hypothetical protein n=1 Tax=Bacillus toyonensis TaxID=155322 RepID=UPI002E1E175B|nr:hypothetical protein [Bacillus toyonensis]